MNSKDFSDPEPIEQVARMLSSCRHAAAGIALLSGLVLASPAVAQDFKITPAVECQYTAGAGQVYELQGSRDLRTWRKVGDVVFGEGDAVSEFVPPESDANGYRFYRVKHSPSKEFGFAPGSLTGKLIAFNDEGDAQIYSFTSRAGGSANGGSFAYRYRKAGDAIGNLVVERRAGESEHIELAFSADLAGSYTRTLRRGDLVVDVDLGTFSLGREAPQPRDQPPAALLGNTYVFSDGDIRERFDFVTPDSGRAVDGVEVQRFTYSYDTGGGSGSPRVMIAFPGDLAIEFTLEFGEGACGSFVRRESVDGQLLHSSEGVFSSARSVYHTDGAESTDVTLPAGELTGRTYVMRDGGTPCQLQFHTLESGRCIQGNLIDDIRYDYVVNCNSTSTITVDFGSGGYDRYQLNHSDQTFLRQEVRGGVLTDTDTGSFSETP